MARLPLCLFVVACCVTVALASGDRTLGTASGPCKDQFASIMKENYATDKDCADLIKKAMTTAPKTDADCPGGIKADVGSPVQKCMTKNQKAKDAWISFIKSCEVLNVNERTGAGEAEAAGNAKPSCFPRFDSLNAFKSALEKTSSGGTKSAATGIKASSTLLAAAAGATAAGLFLLM